MKTSYYRGRINKAINSISAGLSGPFSLDALAEEACFSKYHFVRMFKQVTGETVFGFIRRLRLEKAAYFLIYNEDQSITEISGICGFSSTQNFAKAFSTEFGLSPVKFRRMYGKTEMSEKSNLGNIVRNPENDAHQYIHYSDISKNALHWKSSPGSIRLEAVSGCRAAYISHTGSYSAPEIGRAVGEIVSWAECKGISARESVPFGIFWDNAAVTDKKNCRFDACIAVPDQTEILQPVEEQLFSGGIYAVYTAEIKIGDFYRHWNLLLKSWLPESGYRLDERPSVERYLNWGATDEPFLMEIGLPVII